MGSLISFQLCALFSHCGGKTFGFPKNESTLDKTKLSWEKTFFRFFLNLTLYLHIIAGSRPLIFFSVRWYLTQVCGCTGFLFFWLIFLFIFSIGSGSKFLVLYARVDRKRCYFLHWNSSDVTTWHYINYVGYVAIALQLDIPQIIYYFPILLRRLFWAKKRVENIRCILIRWLLEN